MTQRVSALLRQTQSGRMEAGPSRAGEFVAEGNCGVLACNRRARRGTSGLRGQLVAQHCQRGSMMAYRCYFLSEDDKIKGFEIIECPSDTAALERAEQRLATCGYPAIEVWDRARYIGIVGDSGDCSDITAQDREAQYKEFSTPVNGGV